MSLFPIDSSEPINLLPKDGTANYYGLIYNAIQTDFYLKTFLETIAWKNDEMNILGTKIVTKRKVAWYGDVSMDYTYSNTTITALSWTDELLAIKKKVQNLTRKSYNACLLNLYHNGSEGLGWHSDKESELEKAGAIASVTFGAKRKFVFKHKETKEKVEIFLENGSLLLMKDEIQSHWLHRLPPTTKIHSPRINLTFRTIVGKGILQ
ncbi:alpha-ketoglutarate-dependent dioxygenase AlkB [Flavobacteriaceae bacterium Ap0902]|nr:alpha-ketoglutarate-dependent dioxygenase AlkB [Flavobacteriaceae bacterium Ap0902]